MGERGEGDACNVLLRRCKEEFVVEKITKHRVHRGVPQWLVVWKGYDSSFGQRAAPSSCAALPRWMGRDTVTDVVRSSSAGYRQARDDAADPTGLGSKGRVERRRWGCCGTSTAVLYSGGLRASMRRLLGGGRVGRRFEQMRARLQQTMSQGTSEELNMRMDLPELKL